MLLRGILKKGWHVRIFHPLRRAPVALLWGGLSLSALGDQLYAVALSWIAVGVLGSNAGYLAAVQALIVLVAVLGIGRWADRWDQQRSMVGADLARASVLLIVVILWLMTGGPSVAQLAGTIVVLAIGQAVFQAALQSVLPSLVGDAHLLPAANALLDTTNRSARLLGPGLVALLAGSIPMVHFLTLDAISFLASAAALSRITRLRSNSPVGCHRVRPQRAADPGRRETIWHGIVRGVRAMAAHPILGYVLATAGPLNGVWYGVFFLGLPLMIAQHGVGGPSASGAGGNGPIGGGLIGGGLGAYGLVLSVYGCTNLAATLFFGGHALPVRPQFQMFGGNILMGSGLALLGLATWLPEAWLLPGLAAAAALGAVGGPMNDIPLAVLRQTRLRPQDMAAGMRVYMATSSAGTLLALLLTPAAVWLAGIAPMIVGCGLIYIGVGLLGLARHAGWVETAQRQPA